MAVPVQLGDQVEVTVVSMGHSGEGIGKVDGYTLFIPGTLPGERVTATVTEVKKKFGRAKLIHIDQPSPQRINPDCTVYGSCGGCHLQHLTIEQQLQFKHQVVQDSLQRIGKLNDVTVHPTLAAERLWHYRNKMQCPLGMSGDTVTGGCFAQGTHDVIDHDACLIQHEINNKIADTIKQLARDYQIPIYDEATGKGLLRHVLGRVGIKTGEVMVALVTTSPQLPHQDAIIAQLRQEIPGLVSVVLNINDRNTNVILGEQTMTLWGRDTITDCIGPFCFSISAKSFFQVNTEQAEVLYNQALEYAGLTGQETVIDAYCGTGTISLFLAQRAKQVIGIEIVDVAIEDARANALRNGVDNAEFIAGDVVTVMPRLYKQGVRPAVIVVDPPRRGCDPHVLDTFAAMQPQRIVYVSCNPSSLARDLAYLDQLGYRTVEVQPVDMFPMTYHVETVVLMSRVKE